MKAAVIYGYLTPCHYSRLETAARLGKERSHKLLAIQVAGYQNDYCWPNPAETARGFVQETLFPGADYWDLPYRSLRQRLDPMLDEYEPDVVVMPGWGFKESLAALRWCMRRGVARVVISDSQAIDNRQTAPRTLLKRWIVRRFQTGLVGGAPHVRYLVELGLPKARCFVGCDVVENDLFSQASSTSTGRSNHQVVKLLSCLRLLPKKNILGVLAALAQRDGWHWTIAGDGPQRTEIEARIQALGLERRVTLLGHIDYSQLPRIYGQADVYLQPSISEPWGLAVNEAMAAGLPVIVSNRCGCHEDLVAEAVNGFVFDPMSPPSLTHAFDRALACRDRWSQMGEASRQIISGWGPDLFGANFWRACETATDHFERQGVTGTLEKALALGL